VDKQPNTLPGITLGSLFDGIGGFPYAASFFGIKTLWASEIMPQAISVTKRHMPGMGHVGDITGLDGAKLPPVDIITFGSPCQDLSVAGKRAGLGGARSGLFAEAIRIIDEMRDATHGTHPRYAVWENVPGALSSGNPRGGDFRAVLESFAKTEVPAPRSNHWANAGMVRSAGADIAWCVYNAQYFGVPQRRRRIFLVCDFGGWGAGEILFVPKSLSRYFAARRAQGQGIAGHAPGGAGGASVSANVKDTAATIFAGYGNHWNGNAGAYDGGNFALSPSPKCLTPWDAQQTRVFTGDGLSPTLAGADGGGGRNPAGLVFQETGAGGDTKPPAAAFMGDSSASSYGIEYMEEGSPTLKPRLGGMPCLCEPNADGGAKCAAFLGGASAKARSIGYSEDVSPTLKGEPCGFSSPCVCEPNIARTLTARGDGSPNIGSGPNIVAVGVHQNQNGGVPAQGTACAPADNGSATGRNEPFVAHASGITAKGNGDCFLASECHYTLSCGGGIPGQGYPAALVAHPAVCGTLVASGAGMSRTAGLASETDLCVVVPEPEPIPIQDKATRCNGGGATRNGDGAGNGLGVGKGGDPAPTITSGDRHAVAAYCLQGNMIGRQDHNGPKGGGVNEEVSFTLNTVDVAAVASLDCRNYSETGELSGTLQAKAQGYSLNYQNPVRSGYIVRRLLPPECEKLQGYPVGWTEFGHDGKKIHDTRRYQMLGNSVAVPCVAYIMLGIAGAIRRGVEGNA
jgi:DNA (cytosine-5)-methyltransferase 1